MKIADKRAANKKAHAARERKAKTLEAVGSPYDDQDVKVVSREPHREGRPCEALGKTADL
jgi:hypothetical protein